MSIERILISLLKAGLFDIPVEAKIADSIDTDVLQQLYTISKAHDVAHILGEALAKCGKLGDDECSRNFRNKTLLAVSRYERISYDLQTICEALENAGIPFIPLKGAVLRSYYPAPWMRTSCDIDVLVRKEDLEAAERVMQEGLEYTPHMEGSHDICFISQCRTYIELHFDLIEDGKANSAGEILKDVWQYATPKGKYKYHHLLSDELFYYYHIAHMVKHFEAGGCGIRSFLDLWFLNNMPTLDWEKRDALLAEGNLLRFAMAAGKLAKVWLEDAPHDHITERMENYVICGGLFGSRSSKIVIQQKKKGGRAKYILSRIFPPYDELVKNYPVLENRLWLTPFVMIYRCFRVISDGRVPDTVKEFSLSQNISKAQLKQLREFFEELGL